MLFASLAFAATAKTPSHLDITAIYTTAANNSAFQCWRLSTPFNVSSTAGTSGAGVLPIGDFEGASVTAIPAGFDGGVHNAPVPQ